MKKNNKKNIINDSNIIFADLQIVLTIIVIILFIFSIFNKKYIIGVEISLILYLLCLAFNNIKIYKRMNATIIYLVAALIIFIVLLLKLLGIGV